MDCGQCGYAGIRQDWHKNEIEGRRQHRHEMHGRPFVVRHHGQIGSAMGFAQRRRILRHVGHARAILVCGRNRCRRHIEHARRRRHGNLLEQQAEGGQQGESKAHRRMVPRKSVSGEPLAVSGKGIATEGAHEKVGTLLSSEWLQPRCPLPNCATGSRLKTPTTSRTRRRPPFPLTANRSPAHRLYRSPLLRWPPLTKSCAHPQIRA